MCLTALLLPQPLGAFQNLSTPGDLHSAEERRPRDQLQQAPGREEGAGAEKGSRDRG